MESVLVFLALSLSGQTPPDASEPVRRIALVYTVNNFGATEPMGCPHKILHDGGLPRRATLLRQLAATGQPTLVLDGGSTFFPEVDKPRDDEREKLFLKGELIAEAMSRMGYRAMALGSTDLLLGIGELTHLAGRARFPVLCANLVVPGSNPFKPHTVVEVGGIRVGVLGLLLDTMGRVYLQKVAPGAQILPAIPAARKVVEELRKKADLIVALSHLRQETNRQLAAEVRGIDIVIDPSIEYGNHHPRIKDQEWEELLDRTIILRADGNGSAVGVLEIDFRRPGAGMGSRARLEALLSRESEGTAEEPERAELKDLRGRNLFSLRRLPLAPHYADDQEASMLMEAHKSAADLAAVKAPPVLSTRTEYLTASACKDCHHKQYEYWTTTRHFTALESVRASRAEEMPECISCHTTGYGPAFLAPADSARFAGIQCEACHGTSPEHVKEPTAHRFAAVGDSVCLPCHNEDILRKGFSYRTALKRVQCPSDRG